MKIDINCDLGEGMGNDALLMPLLGSCNIACGGHFGDVKSMTSAIELAKEYNVDVGAHPSFPDKKYFGRKVMDISLDDLVQSVFHQISAFQKVCEQLNQPMHHIKLHGALYNQVVKNQEVASAMLNVFATCQPGIKIYAPFQSMIAFYAEDYLPIVYEAFADRSYNADLSLVARDKPGAIITNKEKAWQQVSTIIKTGKIQSIDGQMVNIKADTFCVHGDNENSYEILKHINKCL